MCEPGRLNNNRSLHFQFIISRDAQAVLAHWPLVLNIVFTAQQTDPSMQSQSFEYQQHASTPSAS